jgi:hypothetical protein
MAQFVFLYRRGREQAQPSPAQMQERMQKWMAWLKQLEDQGHLKDRGLPLDPGGKVVSSKKQITDGPYAEKDLVMGFSLVQAESLAEAAHLATGCPAVEFGGSVEVRTAMPLNM